MDSVQFDCVTQDLKIRFIITISRSKLFLEVIYIYKVKHINGFNYHKVFERILECKCCVFKIFNYIGHALKEFENFIIIMICLLKLTVTTLFAIKLLLANILRQIELFATTLIFSRFLCFQTITAERVLTDLKLGIQALKN